MGCPSGGVGVRAGRLRRTGEPTVCFSAILSARAISEVAARQTGAPTGREEEGVERAGRGSRHPAVAGTRTDGQRGCHPASESRAPRGERRHSPPLAVAGAPSTIAGLRCRSPDGVYKHKPVGTVVLYSLHAACYEHGWKNPPPIPEPPMPARATRTTRWYSPCTLYCKPQLGSPGEQPAAPCRAHRHPGLVGSGQGDPGPDSSRPGSPPLPRGRSDPNVVGLVSRRFRRPAGATNPGGAARGAMESIVVQERRRAAQHV